MKVISTTDVRSNPGAKRVLVELMEGEHLMAVRADAHYRLSHPLGDIVPGRCLREAAQVSWCPAEQEWRE